MVLRTLERDCGSVVEHLLSMHKIHCPVFTFRQKDYVADDAEEHLPGTLENCSQGRQYRSSGLAQ